MILRQLKTFLAARQSANILEISHFLQVDVAVARDLIGVLQKKGCVCSQERKKKCGTACQKCNPLLMEVYCWQEPSPRTSNS